jgi:hypothetical protein
MNAPASTLIAATTIRKVFIGLLSGFLDSHGFAGYDLSVSGNNTMFLSRTVQDVSTVVAPLPQLKTVTSEEFLRVMEQPAP